MGKEESGSVSGYGVYPDLATFEQQISKRTYATAKLGERHHTGTDTHTNIADGRNVWITCRSNSPRCLLFLHVLADEPRECGGRFRDRELDQLQGSEALGLCPTSQFPLPQYCPRKAKPSQAMISLHDSKSPKILHVAPCGFDSKPFAYAHCDLEPLDLSEQWISSQSDTSVVHIAEVFPHSA